MRRIMLAHMQLTGSVLFYFFIFRKLRINEGRREIKKTMLTFKSVLI